MDVSIGILAVLATVIIGIITICYSNKGIRTELKGEMKGLNGRMDKLDGRMDILNSRMDGLWKEVSDIKKDVGYLKGALCPGEGKGGVGLSTAAQREDEC